jgi:hypothetical protein
MKKDRHMTCEEFTASMAELVASGEDIFSHPHVKSCPVHRALLEDLEAIASAARQLLPDVDPSDGIWEKIKGEIAPAGEPGDDERVSDPFPGCHLVFRIKVMENWKPQDDPMAYDDHLGARDLPVPGTQMRTGHKSPPHPGEGR